MPTRNSPEAGAIYAARGTNSDAAADVNKSANWRNVVRNVTDCH